MLQTNILPQEKKCTFGEGRVTIKMAAHTEYKEWENALSLLRECFYKINGIELELGKGGFELILDESLAENAYKIDVDEDGMRIYASADEGMNYAIASALMLAVYERGEFTIQKVSIEDWPDKDYRCLMVNGGSTFITPAWIYKYIDVCFILKIKYLHAHFMDNGVYSLPSKAFPKLAVPGKSYTFEDIEGFRKYANDRGVIIVPEIELPGHAKIIIAAYPEIFANKLDEKIEFYRPELGETEDGREVICAGSSEANDAVETLVAEMCEMFPESPYIHIGGDEANHYAWKACKCCKQYIKEKGLADENELYSEFIGRMARMVLKRGKTPIIWEGFPPQSAHHVPKEAIVVAWESLYNKAYELLDSGFKIINGSWKPLYIVNRISTRWNPYDIMNWNMYRWENYFELSEATLNPVQVTPTDRVLGAQISNWSAYPAHDMGFTIENLAALAERTWNEKRRYTDEQFTFSHSRATVVASKLINDRE